MGRPGCGGSPPHHSGSPGGDRGPGSSELTPGNPVGDEAPRSQVRAAESKTRQQVAGAAPTPGPPGPSPSRASRHGFVGLRPPRLGASCGTPTRSAVAATRESASRPATPHSLLHSSSAHTLRSEKRRPGLGSGWPGTHQSGPSKSSQRSSPGAAAMLWAPRARVTRRPPAGGAGGGAGAGGAGGGAGRRAAASDTSAGAQSRLRRALEEAVASLPNCCCLGNRHWHLPPRPIADFGSQTTLCVTRFVTLPLCTIPTGSSASLLQLRISGPR